MTTFNEYRVTGPRPWRGTPVGETSLFDPADESVQRAVDCGVLTLIKAGSVGLDQSRVMRPKPEDLVVAEGDETAASVPAESGGTEE